MDHIHLSAAYTCAKRLTTQQQPEAAVLQQLLQFLHQSAVRLQQQCGARELANIIWSCACLNRADTVQLLLPELLQDSKLQQANPQEPAIVLWACATLHMQLAAADVQQLVQRFVQVLPQAKPQCISNTLWACATMDLQLADRVMEELVQRFVQLLPQASQQTVANTLWACGRMRYAPQQLLSALDLALPQSNLLAAAVPQSLANMALACGQLGYSWGKLLPGVLLQQAMQLLQDGSKSRCNMQELCNLCWSAAVLDLRPCVPHVLQLAAACKHVWDAAVDKNLRQLYQVHLWLLDSQLPAPGQGLSGVLSQQQLQQCKHSWEQQLTDSTSSAKASDLHMSVFAAVQALPAGTWQQPPVLERRTADGALSIDIAATTSSGVQLAIEVDGPNHFVRPNRRCDGSTLFRNRALAAPGYILVSIPYWEWSKLHGAAQKQQYLLSSLQEAQQNAAAQPNCNRLNPLACRFAIIAPGVLVIE